VDPIGDKKEEIKNMVDAKHKFLYTAGTLYELMPNGIYAKVEDHQIENYLTSLSLDFLKEDVFTRNDKSNFLDHIQSKCFMRWEDVQKKQDKNLILFKNLVFNIKEFKHYEFHGIEDISEHYFFSQIPHALNEEMLNESVAKNYTPEQALQTFAPHIYAFFKDIVGEDKVILQLTKIGYVFYPNNPFKLMFMEIGAKDAGKTTFLKLFMHIIGERNISTISLQDLADYRFARAELWGKLVNIYDDIPLTTIRNQGIIKMLSGESRIDAPVKYKQEIQSFINTAKSIYTANRLPFVYDSTDEAFFSRWVITNYPNHFPRNDGFYQSLIGNEEEIEGLIVASLLALRDLLTKKFSFEDKTKENMELWQRQNNNVYAFITDSVQAGIYSLREDLRIDKDTLYESYVDYCNDTGTDAKSKTKFTQDLQRLFGLGTTKVQKAGKQVWGYSGIGVRTSTQTELEDHKLTQPPDQNSNVATLQDPTKPDNAHAATTKSSISSHSDAQAQANQEVHSPNLAEPAPDNHNANTSQTQQQVTVMLSKTTQETKAVEKETSAAPQEQQKPLTKEEVIQRTFIAVQLSEKYGEPFWEDIELGEPNKKLFPALQGLYTEEIKEALKSLQRQGFIAETKLGQWRAVRDLHLLDILYYNDPAKPVYCPSCGKPVTKLYWYDTGRLCVDCLNARQHQSDELFGE